MIRVGIIGSGKRGIQNLGSKIIQNPNLGIEIVALADNLQERLPEAAEILNVAAKEVNFPVREFSMYTDWKQMLEKEDLDFVMITTPQCAHQEPFEAALKQGLKVYCDKPMAHTSEAAYSMLNVWNENGQRNAILGFTRRYENAWKTAHVMVENGDIGEVKMILLKSVIPYSTYFRRWFSDSSMSGGVINEKASHHFDAMQWFAHGRVKHVSAMGGRNIYLPQFVNKGFCHNCDELCEYRPPAISTQDQLVGNFPSAVNSEDIRYSYDRCVFDPKTDIMDHAIVNLCYDNNVKGQLFLNIAGFSTDDQETFEVIGSSGKLQLERHTGKIKIYRDFGRDIEGIDARGEDHSRSHFGADDFLLQQISDFASGKIEYPPAGPLEGAMSTITASLATKSCKIMEVYKTDFDKFQRLVRNR